MKATNPGSVGQRGCPGDPNGSPFLVTELTQAGAAARLTVGDLIPRRTGVCDDRRVRVFGWWMNTATPLTVVVWDTSTGESGNVRYYVTGFASLTMTERDLSHNTKTGRFQRWVIPEGTSSGPNSGITILKLNR